MPAYSRSVVMTDPTDSNWWRHSLLHSYCFIYIIIYIYIYYKMNWSTKIFVFLELYICMYKINLNRESEFVIGSTRVEHSCDCSIAAFTVGFIFLLTNWLHISWFFSTGVTGLAFSFFLSYDIFFPGGDSRYFYILFLAGFFLFFW